jgi:hypothetical protein
MITTLTAIENLVKCYFLRVLKLIKPCKNKYGCFGINNLVSASLRIKSWEADLRAFE